VPWQHKQTTGSSSICAESCFGSDLSLPDADLLGRFVHRRDEAAFEALVRRHGPMVFGVCLRILRQPQDAEDAFQATFLVLARKAACVRPREMLGNWLYGVAQQTAVRVRSATYKRSQREQQLPTRLESAAAPDQRDDWEGLLDHELSLLPDKYRAAIVLCDLEGKTRKEAARQLGWPEGTVAARLARAHALLAKRLTRRGVAFSGGALAGIVSLNIASASLPSSLIASTSRAAILYAAGQSAGAISTKVAVLAKGVLNIMLLTKLKTISATALMLTLVLGFGGVVPWQSSGYAQVPENVLPRGPYTLQHDNLTATLLALDKHYWEITARGDGKELAKFLADDFVSISIHGKFGKSDAVASCHRYRLKDWKIADPTVVRVNKDSAVLTYLYDCKVMTADGELDETREGYRVTYVWTLRDGGWVVVFCHDDHGRKAPSTASKNAGPASVLDPTSNTLYPYIPTRELLLRAQARRRTSSPVGIVAPPIVALHADGNAMLPEHLKGKHTLLTFWSAGGDMPFAELSALRKEFAKDDRFRIVSVCVDTANNSDKAWAAWSKWLLSRGSIDFGDGPKRLIDDPQWWNVMENANAASRTSAQYGVRFPESFLIGPDGNFVAVYVANKDLQKTVAAALGEVR
jgi:RNA polymerase sigma factor (sigma-70 family)